MEIISAVSLLFLKKLRDKVADLLNKGDLFYRDIRDLIVDDIKDLKSKINLQARKDLETCINIFAEEIENHISRHHRKSKEDENYSAEMASSQSKTRLETANLKATEAFGNKALDISDLILATKYRIQTRLLVTLDKPANAFVSCVAILKQLNDDPTIKKTFEVQLAGGAKAIGGRRRREEIISSVCEVNRLVYDIMQMAVSDEDSQFYRLPGVHIGKEVIDPLRDLKVVEVLRRRDMKDVSVLWSFGGEGDGKLSESPQSIATNTLGDFIVADSGDREIKMFDRRGNFLKSFRCVQTYGVEHETLDLDTDGDGNMYLLVNDNGMYKVYVLDKKGNRPWTFPLKKTSKGRALAFNRGTGNILILEGEIKAKYNAVVEVYKNDGDFAFRFGERYLRDAVDIAAATDGRIFVLDNDQNSISVFNEQGEPLSEFKVVPNAVAVSFHHGDSSVVVASFPVHVVHESVIKRRARISLYSVMGDHWRTIDLDAWCVRSVRSIAVTENGCIAVALAGYDSFQFGSKVMVL